MNRRGNIAWSDFWNGYCRRNIYEFAALAVIATMLSAIGFLFMWGLVNDPINEQHTVAKVLSSAGNSAELQEMASSMLLGSDLYENNSTEDFLREVVRKGAIPSIEESITWYGDYVTSWLFWIGAISFIGIQLIVAYNLFNESARRRQRMMDLPWRKPWAWLFVIFTLVPGILYYPVSLYRTVQERNVLPPKVEESSGGRSKLIDRVRDRHHFAHNPDAARIAYRRARIGDRRRDLERVLSRARDRVASLTGELTRLAKRLREAQQEKGEQLALANKTERELEQLVEATPERAQVEDEFEQLMQLPCVIGVNASGDTVNVLTYVTLEYANVTYFQGVWQISFSASDGLSVRCVDTGVEYSWEYGIHPDYRDRDQRYQFCMGSRQEEILAYAARREYLEAVGLLVNCFTSVNPQDEYLIPQVYRKAGEYL